MPAQRYPWFKVWHEAIGHEKVALLPDAVFRTWIHALSAAAQQPKRGQFASAKHAAVATGRPVAHFRRLIAAGLIDVDEEGHVSMHDFAAWQDKRPSDFTRSERRRAGAEGRSKVGHATDKKAGSLKEGEGDREKEGEGETLPSGLETTPAGVSTGGDTAPTAAVAAAPPQAKANGHVHPGHEDLEPLLVAFDQLGMRRPALTGFASRDARDLLRHFEPEVIARCWQDYASGEYGDTFSRRELSFSYLAKNNRVGNWQREQEAARVEASAVPALPALPVNGRSY